MVRKIIRFPSPSLRLKCREVPSPLPPEVREHIQDLRETLAQLPQGLALASNQLLSQGWRLFVARSDLRVPRVAWLAERSEDGMQSFPEVAINPAWEAYPPGATDVASPRELAEHAAYVEGCLSLPELSLRCPREYWVEWEYTDEDGRRCVHVDRGLGARVVQHECDHLDGKLIYDYADLKAQVRARAEAIRNRKAGR